VPELPDLEVIKENLKPKITGKKITEVKVFQPATIKTFFPEITSLIGDAFSDVSRRGKHLVFPLTSGLFFAAHLKLAGSFAFLPSEERISKPTALALGFSGGNDLRLLEPGYKKLAAIYLVSDPNQIPGIKNAGLEPLDPGFSEEDFSKLLLKSRKRLKSFLTDQKLIAGIGNAYSDEILFEARLSPTKITSTLTPEEISRLRRAIPKVLTWAIKEIKTRLGEDLPERSVRDFLKVHGRFKEPCYVCGTPIAEISYRDRSTNYCPFCQTGGNLLADRRYSRFLK